MLLAGQTWLLRGHFVDLRQRSILLIRFYFWTCPTEHIALPPPTWPHVAAAAASSRLTARCGLVTGCPSTLHRRLATLLPGLATLPGPHRTLAPLPTTSPRPTKHYLLAPLLPRCTRASENNSPLETVLHVATTPPKDCRSRAFALSAFRITIQIKDTCLSVRNTAGLIKICLIDTLIHNAKHYSRVDRCPSMF